MKTTFQTLYIILAIAMLPLSCSERKSDQAQGSETELAGDEPDESRVTSEQQSAKYDPSDTVVNLNQEDVPVYLRDHAQVVVSAYLDVEEALAGDSADVAKDKAQQLVDILLRHEQENMDLTPEVRDFYTNAAHVIRESAETITSVNELSEIKISFSPMAPAAYKLARIADLNDQQLYYHHCPESFDNNGAYWLSRSQEVRNPYADEGSKSCGKTVAVL